MCWAFLSPSRKMVQFSCPASGPQHSHGDEVTVILSASLLQVAIVQIALALDGPSIINASFMVPWQGKHERKFLFYWERNSTAFGHLLCTNYCLGQERQNWANDPYLQEHNCEQRQQLLAKPMPHGKCDKENVYKCSGSRLELDIFWESNKTV